MSKIRVLVVEDSITVRKRLIEVLEADPELVVVGEADNGKRAIELCQELRPSVITLDMMLPVMTGLAATEYIMAHVPTPILIVSASTNRGELFRTYEALAAGAVDVLEKPRATEPDDDEWDRHFIATVKLVSRIRVITHPRARLVPPATVLDGAAPPRTGAATVSHRVIALGASTGGPGALVKLLRTMPPVPAPILVVLHIDAPFGSAFADWLDGQTPQSVVFARDGEPLEAAKGRVTMAPPGTHLLVSDGQLRLSTGPARLSCRPSIDVLFESVAQEHGALAAAALLTGMGRDGAAGLLAIRQAGGVTIAQDEATSVIYGMPREAVLLGATQRVLPLDEIGPALARTIHR